MAGEEEVEEGGGGGADCEGRRAGGRTGERGREETGQDWGCELMQL